jgi:hypothetical protein
MKVFVDPDNCPSEHCCYRLASKHIYMTIHTWSRRRSARKHEEGHVQDGKNLVFLPTVSYALSVTGCYGSLRQAHCFKNLAERLAPAMYFACGMRDTITTRDDMSLDFYQTQHAVWSGRCDRFIKAFQELEQHCASLTDDGLSIRERVDMLLEK